MKRTFLLFVLMWVVVSASALTSPQAAAQAPQASQALPPGYVGSETCAQCHDASEASIRQTKHGRAADARTPMATLGCESCHGPGQAHVDDDEKKHIRTLSAKAPADVNQTCLTCHNRGDHAAWEGSVHESRNLACTTCHSVHASKSSEHQLVKSSETEVCATCHRAQVSKVERSMSHMPVREGKMSCSSCHNPHGSVTNVKALKTGTSVNESCTSCHAEMRGPMLFEHAPVRENCVTCHDPHGSSNDRMLTARLPMLCQRCHVSTRHPASVYDNAAVTTSKNNRMLGRSCVNCHSNIHGSNHPSGQFFMR
ncbi:MAG: DmsE family decaheme c-type cytochrome [Acidobacteriaceae bacterium]|jgi:DmsE family decaheme c-type cytochrome|nr:DmsE family decaheme c-type cytochrome [Acidobacteriaceae bacterium]